MTTPYSLPVRLPRSHPRNPAHRPGSAKGSNAGKTLFISLTSASHRGLLSISDNPPQIAERGDAFLDVALVSVARQNHLVLGSLTFRSCSCPSSVFWTVTSSPRTSISGTSTWPLSFFPKMFIGVTSFLPEEGRIVVAAIGRL